jgi:hypothetical protein
LRPLGPTVLVVDGSIRAHKIAQQLTAGVGVKVVTASTVTGAIDLAASMRIDVLMLGSEHDLEEKSLVAREVRKLHPDASLLWLDLDLT